MNFAVRNVSLDVPFDVAWEYLADMTRLPEWTNAFAEVAEDGSAKLRTPEGEVDVRLEDLVDRANGVLDTRMTFPDGSTGMAYSRLLPLGDRSCVYSFVLTPPPVPLEALEGSLAEQAAILEDELCRLKANLEAPIREG